MDRRDLVAIVVRTLAALPVVMACGCGACRTGRSAAVFVLDEREGGRAGAPADCARVCGTAVAEWDGYRVERCTYVDRSGSRAVECTFAKEFCEHVGVGRRPEGLVVAHAGDGGGVVGDFFARVAALEAASVPAFARLARELALHGAPPDLVARARRAADEEARHHRTMSGLARRYGAEPAVARVDAMPDRALEDVARENAVEGCARETYGALVALWQGRVAEDPLVRRAMARIGDDESRHAELAWAVDAWARGRMGRAAARRLEDERRAAIAALRPAARRHVPRLLSKAAGLPTAAEADRLLTGLEAV